MPIKTSFFGYVREFDLNGENITRDTAIPGLYYPCQRCTRGEIKATLVILK